MKNLDKKVKELLETEEQEKSNESKLKEIIKTITSLDELEVSKKQLYDPPPVDTIGKNFYSSIKSERSR